MHGSVLMLGECSYFCVVQLDSRGLGLIVRELWQTRVSILVVEGKRGSPVFTMKRVIGHTQYGENKPRDA